MKLYREIAQTVDAYRRCLNNGNEWLKNHLAHIKDMEAMLPSGAGIDTGCRIDLQPPKGKIVIYSSHHKMHESGFYQGWLDFTVTVSPSLERDFDLTIHGKGLEDDVEYLYETFDFALHQDV